MTENPVQNCYEIVFLYDVRDANPNGDPDASNQPRMDEVTGENMVTDVRLKRTVRDYWRAKEIEVLVRAEDTEEGTRKSMEQLVRDAIGTEDPTYARPLIAKNLPTQFIDVRSFGATVTFKKANFAHTGAAQFGLGRSLNLPTIQSKTITTSMSSAGPEAEGKQQGSIGEYHTVDYSLIRFHGVVSQVTAKKIGFTDADLASLLQGLWWGTKQLNTRSKFNHVPRLLLLIKYNTGTFQIGDLDLGLTLAQREGIKSIDDVDVNVAEFLKRLKYYEASVEEISGVFDANLKLNFDGDSLSSFKDGLAKAQITVSFAELNLGSDGAE